MKANPEQVVVEFEKVYKTFSQKFNVLGGLKNLVLGDNQISLNQVSEITALIDVSFKIRNTEVVGVIGKNGSGKSTLLGLIAGVIQPSSGKIRVVKKVSALLELGGGFHPDLDAKENILLNAVLLGMTLNDAKKMTDCIISFAELEEFASHPVRVFSSGMLARLGFSIVAHTEPSLLIIDEVLAVGDECFKYKCHSILDEFKKNGIPMLFVSHDTNEIKRICSRVIWIDNHRIMFDGNVDEGIYQYHKSLGYV